MKSRRFIIVFALCVLCSSARAEYWSTYFAYNNVTQIAMTSDKVFAVSDGSLFSVHKQTEKIQVYNRQSGLHGTGITSIFFDRHTRQLIIGYATGKIDIMTSGGVKYLGELYDKDMTQRKTINNITVYNYIAYISTAFGIQTLDLRTDRLVDSYWLRPSGIETDVQDVVIKHDSIYAFTVDSMFCASLKDNIVDYTFWRREIRTGRVSPDTEKGTHYTDRSDHWYVGYAEGIVRITPAGRIAYKPQGPLTNIPYRIRSAGNKLGIVQGGNESARFNREGILMTLENGQWRNYDQAFFTKTLGFPTKDYTDLIYDPADVSHFYVSTFGYGLIEFRKNEFYKLHIASNSAIESVLADHGYPYYWVDGLCYDANGNLWMLNKSANGVKVLMKDGSWVSLSNKACFELERPHELIISNQNPSIKIISDLQNSAIGVMDDNGTIADQSDDRAVLVNTFTDKAGNEFVLDGYLRTICQTQDGALLLGVHSGLYRIADPSTLLDGNNRCDKIAIALPSEDLTDIFADVRIHSIMEDRQGRVWVGTNLMGLFCLSADLKSVLYHFSMDNSPMPSNNILSLNLQEATNNLYIGTSDGLIVYNENGTLDIKDDGKNKSADENDEYEMGHMQQWRLHYSYSEPTEVAATPQAVFAVADGSLFSVDRADESVHYWNKSNGLSGNSIVHIAYTSSTGHLIIAYADGRVDLLDADGDVMQVPDLSMKAGLMPTTINCIAVGSRYTYLGTEFGILALNTKKGEYTDTYYLGEDAASMNIQQIVESGDSLYAFSNNRLYTAALNDNLVDYMFWHGENLPCEYVQQAAAWNKHIYTLQHDSLYRREGAGWTLVLPQPVQWIHAANGQMMLYIADEGLFLLTEEEKLAGLTSFIPANDGVFSQGEYWLTQTNVGLVRLTGEGTTHFTANGPNSNFGYFMTSAHGQVYSTIGGRWGGLYVRFGKINIYNGSEWRCIDNGEIGAAIGKAAVDLDHITVDANDPGHFFVSSYGRGVFEFRDYKAVKCYDAGNSPLREAKEGIDPNLYTYTDGATLDEEGNLWVLNSTELGKPILVLSSDGIWYPLQERVGGEYLTLTTPTGIWTDKRGSNYKWLLDQRGTQGVLLLDDGGTPTYSGDDYCVKHASFIDQKGNTLSPKTFRCWAQDRSNRVWIGTESGIITIPSSVDFFNSNACQRIIIPRNDGTGLGDYLLGDEQINCLALDGGNRMWIGTENSGLYLIEDDTITVAHFTEDNSLLPSNAIQSITIVPETGEVFVGTDKGIASYRSDASEPRKDMSGAYAYPNPVKPDYRGVISITGLMDNSVVNIVDAGGNLVCKTRSHGGTAVWDGNDAYGRRATPGVYTALCNADGGHAAVKILIVR
ncbi:MAG: hypothetical protein J5884_05210 [Paludibacteraceae bacterium]|nr:hypothetical protein [Paludibacteraceae bacterium]